MAEKYLKDKPQQHHEWPTLDTFYDRNLLL